MVYVHSSMTTIMENYWNVPSTQEFECVFPSKLYLLLLIFAFSKYFTHFIPVISGYKGTPPVSIGSTAAVCYTPHLRKRIFPI